MEVINMKKFKVVLFTANVIWDEVEAKDEEEAIGKCNYPPEFDSNEEHTWKAEEIEED